MFHYLPAVHHNGSSVLRIGLLDSFEKVQQGCCQFGSAIVWPLGVMKLQHCAGFSRLELERRGGEGFTWLSTETGKIQWLTDSTVRFLMV